MLETRIASTWDAVLHWWFWAAFWPTAAGAALGIPVALWLYNVNARTSAKEAKRGDEERLYQVVLILIETLKDHIPKLGHASGRSDNQFETISDLGIAPWEAVRADTFRLLPDISTRARLATYFENVHRLNVAHEHRMQRITSRFGQGLYSDPSINEAPIHHTLKKHAEAATREATALLESLRELTAAGDAAPSPST